MSKIQTKAGFAAINNAKIHYEMAGTGQPFVMIHAGVADLRQWENEFRHFAEHYQVLRYDMRGYGQSEPAEGEFSHLQDLVALLDALEITKPAILMGCSMGGGIAMNFALEQPARAKALIMAGSGPNGLKLDPPTPADFQAKFDQAEKAYEDGDLELVAELQLQIWCDGLGRTPEQVNPEMRKLVHEMIRHDLELDARDNGKVLPDTQVPAAERLGELQVPVLVIVGVHDTPYILAAADIMVEKIPLVKKVMLADAAHLLNMDQPEEFRKSVEGFLGGG